MLTWLDTPLPAGQPDPGPLKLSAALSADGARVAAGSANRNMYVWDAKTAELQYTLPGHKGSVNAVDIHPLEPIVVSGSSDRRLLMGEIAAV